MNRTLKWLFFVAANLFVLSFKACNESFKYDQSSNCVIIIDETLIKPPGYELLWPIGVASGICATGLCIAALNLWRGNHADLPVALFPHSRRANSPDIIAVESESAQRHHGESKERL